MEQKFESELGKRVAEGSWRRPSRKVAFIAVTLSACALMISSAAFLLPVIAGEETGKPVYWQDIITAQNDYLVNEDGVMVHYTQDQMQADTVFDVKRTATLKAAVFDSPSRFSVAQYNKYVYSVNVNLRDLSNIAPGGVVAGVVTIPYSGEAEPVVSWSMSDAGVLVASSDDEIPAWSPVGLVTADGSITATVTLPEGYAYTEGSQISIQVMVKVPLYTPLPWDEDIVEEAFPDFADLVIPSEEEL